ncbi:hypothetical protein GUJ93_ZPchr0002g24949 [Zizania palustris]|uniref:Uncharacterized protein n=1 Tax=Zizania palustris TaxID=103762 RepID=A0A8J5VUS8_ZIZPA|nr:hypothetical protein GUJ93_ZPchr0002g24949 [Zizania palustris]
MAHQCRLSAELLDFGHPHLELLDLSRSDSELLDVSYLLSKLPIFGDQGILFSPEIPHLPLSDVDAFAKPCDLTPIPAALHGKGCGGPLS